MKTVCQTLGVARSNIAARATGGSVAKILFNWEIPCSPLSSGLALKLLGQQRYRFRQRAGSNAEGAFNDAGFTTDVARQVENGRLALA